MGVNASDAVPVWRDFEPKGDITVVELAAVVGAMRVTVSANVFAKLPKGVQRHFSPPWIG